MLFLFKSYFFVDLFPLLNKIIFREIISHIFKLQSSIFVIGICGTLQFPNLTVKNLRNILIFTLGRNVPW